MCAFSAHFYSLLVNLGITQRTCLGHMAKLGSGILYMHAKSFLALVPTIRRYACLRHTYTPQAPDSLRRMLRSQLGL
ncbi:hypothetical protein GGR58DRAFT_462229 [Xylaria digitata]|nr:hypothetical protein GGR58DRAFT_462229 [Xylaria digitata]